MAAERSSAPSGDHAQAIRRVGEALVARHEEIGRSISGRVMADIPEYARAAGDLLDDLESGATATAEVLARTLAADTALRREDVGFVRALAARRVEQGVSLEVFLHAYRVALFAFWDACAEEASRLDLSREAGFALAAAALDAIDTLTTQAADGYLREQIRARTQSGREARDLVERLIRGQPVDDQRRVAPAGLLDPAAQLVTVVGRVDQTDIAVGDALQVARDALEEDLSLGKVRPLVAVRHGEIVAVAAATSSRATVATLRNARRRALREHGIDVHYGVSVPSPGLPAVEQTYREAMLSLSYTSPARPIVSLEELSSLECALIGADATTKAVIASKGAELQALSDDELALTAETIRAFSGADLNIARAAELMHVHPNTVRYRLERIAARTGHDPRTFAGLVELLCILEAGEVIRPRTDGSDA